MNITIIHGQAHKGSGYHVSKCLRDNLANGDSTVREFTLPADAGHFCVGCYNCIRRSSDLCPHRTEIQPIVTAMEQCDVMIIDSPTYCMEMSGPLKSFFDHLGYMWLTHRPSPDMFDKVAIVVSTAAGGGAGGVTKSIARQLLWLGVPAVYRVASSVNASSWDEVPERIKSRITQRVEHLSARASAKVGHAKPGLKLRFLFRLMLMMQRRYAWNPVETEYWSKQGWLGGKRPW